MRHFPLFADLRGRRVLVVGGGEVAERKVRRLLDAGAHVDVVAPEITEWLASRESVSWLAPSFDESDLDGAVLAVTATNDGGVNARVAAAARARNILVNVVDDAELSSFIMPAIVDRSPLVVAISTGGAAPVLARLLRERLEALIDDSFGPLVALLERWRARIKAAFPDLTIRRRFYESVVLGEAGRALRAGRDLDAERALGRSIAGASAAATGSVALVGAGPGDPGLLTLNALRALQEADIVLHDRLVTDAVLELSRRDARRILVGKQAGGHTVAQERINELMLEYARAGRRVVRLKGGDPFIFGRGGEELEFLRAHGIAYEVVPGITAAVACGAYAGIPLTHREHAQSVRFVTAHCNESIDTLDWPALARERQTLAFYMGVAGMATIRSQLLQHGLGGATPVAIVENGSQRDQRVTVARLTDLDRVAAGGDIRAPALIVVGEVAALAAELHWFGHPPRRWAAALEAA